MVVQTNVQLDPTLNDYVMYFMAVTTAAVVSNYLFYLVIVLGELNAILND